MGTYTTSRSRHGAEQLGPVAGDAEHDVGVERRDHVQAVARADARGFLARFLEIVAVLDQLHAERAHGGVLLHAVAMRHVHRGR